MARTDLAKAQLHLEGVPRLEADPALIHRALEAERQARHEAEQWADLDARVAESREATKHSASINANRPDAASLKVGQPRDIQPNYVRPDLL